MMSAMHVLDDFKRRLYDAARVPIARFGRENREHFEIRNPPRYARLRDDARVAITDRWEHLMVIVAGGAGKHSAVMFTFGSTRAITRRIDG